MTKIVHLVIKRSFPACYIYKYVHVLTALPSLLLYVNKIAFTT